VSQESDVGHCQENPGEVEDSGQDQ
jgi:hypothetical protein